MSYFGMGSENEAHSSISLESAISRIVLRKQNLDHIYEDDHSATAMAIRAIREDEIDHVLEILRRVKS